MGFVIMIRQTLLAGLVLFSSVTVTIAQDRRAMDLPDGSGKELVQSACGVACHQTDLITGATGYTNERWKHLIGKMINLPEPVSSTVAHYLATNFPQNDERKPTLISGNTEVVFQEWTVPTLGQRPRDPLQTPDGMIWWAGMFGSLIGQLNPTTGEMREFKLDPAARPHSIISDQAGNIWYTGNGNGTVGMLDPETGDITVYPMPDPVARDPHTPVFTRNGDLWFTVQNSNILGRLVPDTGDIRLKSMPTERARPYGIKIDSKGMIWIAYRGANKIAMVDPDSWEITEYETPDPDPAMPRSAHIRRIALTSDDMVWYVDSGRGYIGRLNPTTNKFKEWPSPSGPKSHPYAIEIINDIVWYNESGQRPDALVRFDPKTEKFQSWAIPSGVGIIRHMRVTPDRNLVIHQSSTNTVGLVTLPSPET